MPRTISVSELRRNLTVALEAVRDGHTVTVMSDHRPIADLVPHVQRPGISGADFTTRVRHLFADEKWPGDLAAARATDDRDHWPAPTR